MAALDRSINSFLVPHIHALSNAGYIVETACRFTDAASELRAKGVVAHHIGFARSPIHWRNVKAFRELKQLIDRRQYNVVHAHMPTSGVLGRLAAALSQIPVILYTVHGFHFYDTGPPLGNAIFRFIERNLARISTGIITINGDDYLAAKQWTAPGKGPYVFHIPGVGIDISRFGSGIVFNTTEERQTYRSALGITPDEVVVGTVGSCTERKRHRDLIRAVAQIIEGDSAIKVLIVGDGPLLETEKLEAQRLGLEERVIFVGYRRDIPQLLAAMDIYVQSSHMEGLPVSVMEAMATGLPIIGSNVRGTRDLISDGTNGFLFTVGDSQNLGRNLRKLIVDHKLRSIMARQGRSRIKEYDQDHICRQLVDVYNTLIH